jgi:hypothetical protein
MPTLLRRYHIKPGHWEEFMAMWLPITVIRQRFGFTIEFAYEDREQNIFTWAISHPGDLDEVSARYYADPERVTYQSIKDHIERVDVRPVQPVSWLPPVGSPVARVEGV